MTKTKRFDPYKLSKKIIEGVPVYYKNLPWAPCIHIRAVFNSGAFNDPVGKEGVSHFLEHIIFDGSPTLPDKKAIRDWQKKYTLNTWNAWTGYYNTTFWCKFLPEHTDEVLRGMKDMIFNPLLRDEDVEHERKVIIQEAWGRYKNEKFLNYVKECQKNMYADNSNLQRIYSSLGWPDTVQKISASDLKKMHENYGKENMFLVLVGKIENSDLAKIKKFLKDIPKTKNKKLPQEKIIKPVKNLFKKIGEEIGDPKEQAEISITRTNKPFNKTDSGMADLFSRVFSDILHEKLREEKALCYSLHFGSYTEKTFSDTMFNVKTDEKNINAVLEEFWKIIGDFNSGKYKEKFEVIKNLLIDSIESSEFLSEDIASGSLRSISLRNEIFTIEEKINIIKKSKYSDVIKFSKRVFDKDYIFTEIVTPAKKN